VVTVDGAMQGGNRGHGIGGVGVRASLQKQLSSHCVIVPDTISGITLIWQY